MQDAIRQAAIMSTARGCGFAGLAIITAMMGFADDPANAFQFGGIAALLSAIVLIMKAWRAPYKPYKKTEVWLLLAQHDRPTDPYAQHLITMARIEAFYRFALICAVVAALFLALGPILSLFSAR